MTRSARLVTATLAIVALAAGAGTARAAATSPGDDRSDMAGMHAEMVSSDPAVGRIQSAMVSSSPAMARMHAGMVSGASRGEGAR